VTGEKEYRLKEETQEFGSVDCVSRCSGVWCEVGWVFNEDIIIECEGLGGFEKKMEVRHSMSRLDMFLLSDNWCLTWCIQVAQIRGLSDHCPILLSVDEESWEPEGEKNTRRGVELCFPFLLLKLKSLNRV
jgi:hypothetical protein